MNFPDFRAFERSFQLMEQVSGRSGRKNKQGLVIIQTRQPEHWVIRDVVNHDYESFYRRDLNERRKFNYPPLSRLIEIMLKHKNNFVLADASGQFGVLLRQKLGNRVFGPHIPLVFRIKNLYLNQFLIRIEKDGSPAKVKALIRDAIREFYTDRNFARIQLQLDVDPV
jgi:primosomal protein N' (replication factor Y)